MVTDELHNGRWKKGHPRPDYYGVDDEEYPETFTEQQARFSKQIVDIGLVRADFQCLQGNTTLLHSLSPFPNAVSAQLILVWWYLSQGR